MLQTREKIVLPVRSPTASVSSYLLGFSQFWITMNALGFLLVIGLLGVTSAQRRLVPQTYTDLNAVPIISYVNDNNYDGSYRYSYETGNGIIVNEEGSLKNRGTDQEAQTARGSYSYTAPDGTPITVNWYADETGFHAEGAHLPTPPPVNIGRPLGRR